MSARIIAFPGTAAALTQQAVAPLVAPAAPSPKASNSVTSLRRSRRIPKENRREDQETISVARMAAAFERRAYDLAQTEPDSKTHRFILHMASIADKLPRNNLRIFTTPDDVIEGLVTLSRRLRIANLEWQLADERRYDAATRRDDDERDYWSTKQDEADAARWTLFERLLRVPARALSEVTTYKLSRRLPPDMGSIDWLRARKPALAAILDEEVARLTAEKDAKKAARIAKRQAGAE